MQTIARFAIKRALVALMTMTAADAVSAGPVTLEVSVTNTTYRTTGAESAAELLAAHKAGSAVCATEVERLEHVGMRQTCGGGNREYSLLVRASFNLAQAADLAFDFGTDWGRGGGIILDDLQRGTSELLSLRTDDIWWGFNWNNRDVLETRVALDAGAYSMTWVGFEGCCAGASSLRLSVDQSTPEIVSQTSMAPYVQLLASNSDTPAVPAPFTAALLVIAAPLLWKRRRG